MKLYALTAASAAVLMLAACGDNRTDDVVQAPAPGAQPAQVTETRADAATADAALAFGMSRQQLEDADLLSASNTDLGDVESLVLDASGTLTHVVIELEGPGDVKVQVPVDQVRGLARNNGADKDLTTDLTAEQLAALPRWTPPAQ
ncbi:hypothetical protein [Brevundimonas sp.]|uniref:hypothetical protein n=1 Tax=Brevundimonas sp. TaxID=1871086 RepID=UPI0028971C60|nr:hypothetical protein [Brevundimonas sp.]